MITFEEPNLAPSEHPDLDNLQYPIYCSVKFDGVRAVIIDGEAYSRKGLLLHTVFHERFKSFLDKTIGTPGVFDCEVFSPDATFQQITSSLANRDGVPLKLYVFDYLATDEWYGTSKTEFAYRQNHVHQILQRLDPYQEYAVPVEQKLCYDKDEIQAELGSVLANGGEGLMLRHPRQLYKHGRSTAKATPEKGGGFFKYKPFDTLDAVIIGFQQKKRLTGEAKECITDIDAFGRSKRGHRKGDREFVDEIGAVICEIPNRTYINDKGKEQKYIFNATWSKGGTVRTDITWQNKEQYIGRWVEVEYQSCGVKYLPRLPRIKRFRPDLD